MRISSRFSIVAFAILSWPLAASAQLSLNISNPSFEAEDGGSAGAFTPGPGTTDWTANPEATANNSGVFVSGSSALPTAPEGEQTLYIQLGYVYQNLDTVLAQGFTYTVTGYIGSRTDYPEEGSTGQLLLYTGDGDLLATSGDVMIEAGDFTFASVTYVADGSHVGENLQIRLVNIMGQPHFDQIEGVSIPEPAQTAALAGLAAILGLLRFRRRSVQAVG